MREEHLIDIADDGLYSVNFACRAWDCGKTKLYADLNKGAFVAVKHDGRTKIKGSEIKRRIASLPEYQPKRPPPAQAGTNSAERATLAKVQKAPI